MSVLALKELCDKLGWAAPVYVQRREQFGLDDYRAMVALGQSPEARQYIVCIVRAAGVPIETRAEIRAEPVQSLVEAAGKMVEYLGRTWEEPGGGRSTIT